MKSKTFLTSGQQEFAKDRATLVEFITGDALLGEQFETFTFERIVPETDQCVKRGCLSLESRWYLQSFSLTRGAKAHFHKSNSLRTADQPYSL